MWGRFGRALGRVVISTLHGVLLGGTAGGFYGFLVMAVGLPPFGGSTPDYALLGMLAGAFLGGIGGAATGLVGGLITELLGEPFTAMAWWLGGAAGGFLSAWVVRGEMEAWWYGIPALIGSACGAAFGWWLQRGRRKLRGRSPRSVQT